MRYKANRNVVYSCKYHIVFCPKYRRRVLVGDVESETIDAPLCEAAPKREPG